MAEPIRPLTRAAGVRQALAPVLDSPARPRGRAHETYSNVPYLLSALGLAYVRGLRIDDATTGVATPTKHFVGYSASEGGLKPPQPIWFAQASRPVRPAVRSRGRRRRTAVGD